jgi:hypothetical protein
MNSIAASSSPTVTFAKPGKIDLLTEAAMATDDQDYSREALVISPSPEEHDFLHGCQPKSTDFLFGGKGQSCQDHPGNKHFLEIAVRYLPRYQATYNKTDQRMVIWEATKEILSYGKFYRYVKASASWIPAGKEFAWTKTGQAFQRLSKKMLLAKKRKAAVQCQTNDVATTKKSEHILSDQSILASIGYYYNEEKGEYAQLASHRSPSIWKKAC